MDGVTQIRTGSVTCLIGSHACTNACLGCARRALLSPRARDNRRERERRLPSHLCSQKVSRTARNDVRDQNITPASRLPCPWVPEGVVVEMVVSALLKTRPLCGHAAPYHFCRCDFQRGCNVQCISNEGRSPGTTCLLQACKGESHWPQDSYS